MSVGLRRFAGVAAVVGGLLLSMGVGRAAAVPAPLPVAAPAPLAAAGTAQWAAAKPHTRVTLSVPARVPPGARVSLTGQVRPGHAGGRVQLQVKEAGTWHRAATAKLSRRSTYTFHRAFRTPGTAVTLRVILPAHSDHRLGVSRTRTVVPCRRASTCPTRSAGQLRRPGRSDWSGSTAAGRST